MRAFLLRTSKVPKPTNDTFLDFFKPFSMASKTALTALSACALDISVAAATASTSSPLFTRITPSQWFVFAPERDSKVNAYIGSTAKGVKQIRAEARKIKGCRPWATLSCEYRTGE